MVQNLYSIFLVCVFVILFGSGLVHARESIMNFISKNKFMDFWVSENRDYDGFFYDYEVKLCLIKYNKMTSLILLTLWPTFQICWIIDFKVYPNSPGLRYCVRRATGNDLGRMEWNCSTKMEYKLFGQHPKNVWFLYNLKMKTNPSLWSVK